MPPRPGLDRAIAQAKTVERQVPKTSLSERDIQQIEEHAKSKDAPKALRELQKRIDDGELSWEDIGRGGHLDDPKVRAALATGVEGMKSAYTLIKEGQDLDDIVDAGAPSPSPSSERAEDDRDDDDYFGGSIAGRER
ncbi:MAG: hypothetical protein ACRDQ7_06960 [Haloechinothrix sp.]